MSMKKRNELGDKQRIRRLRLVGESVLGFLIGLLTGGLSEETMGFLVIICLLCIVFLLFIGLMEPLP